MHALILRVALAALLGGVTITWSTFHSQTYPYTISQPSSYRHIVLQDTAQHSVDFFVPSLGSSVTNVTVYADQSKVSATSVLKGAGGHHVHRLGWLHLEGQHVPLIGGNFTGIADKWTLEQAVFTANGRVWHLTASYANRFRNQRPIMLRMLKSFKAK